jgi:hypothetical protein
VNGFDGEKVVSISCGGYHSMAQNLVVSFISVMSKILEKNP